MKRCLILLTFLLLSVPGFSESFDAEDKVLYFNADILIDAIKKNFDSKVQLDVAKKYTELMDDKGNVSIADLIMVCGVDNLDSVKCRKFIGDLIAGTNDDTIKPFYWADYVSKNPEPIRLAVFASGDGYHKNSGLDNGEWALTFGWMNDSGFKHQYSQTKYIRGISACTNEVGIKNVADTSKNFSQKEQSGSHCWCKMTGPEESAWVYNRGDDMAGGCARSCALECVSALRRSDDESMRRAMFTAVKLNGSNVNTNDENVIGDTLTDEFKPCEFDWANDTKWSNDKTWYGWKTQKNWPSGQPASMKLFKYWDEKSGGGDHFLTKSKDHSLWIKEQNANGLKYEEWAAGGFNWMKSENFQCKYPGVKKIKGVATCNREKGKDYNTITNKKFIPNERTGLNCWCKMTYPEQSKWFFDNYWTPTFSEVTTEDWNVENTTTTQDGKVIKYDRYVEKRKIPQEEIDLRIQADIDNCDSFCLTWCARVAASEEFDNAFKSIGKK